MSEINLSSFPANDQEAIAFLYVQNQDLSGLSPEEIYDKYRDAYKKIHYHKIKHHSNTSATKFTIPLDSIPVNSFFSLLRLFYFFRIYMLQICENNVTIIL